MFREGFGQGASPEKDLGELFSVQDVTVADKYGIRYCRHTQQRDFGHASSFYTFKQFRIVCRKVNGGRHRPSRSVGFGEQPSRRFRTTPTAPTTGREIKVVISSAATFTCSQISPSFHSSLWACLARTRHITPDHPDMDT